MNYLTPQEEINRLNSQLQAYKQFSKSASAQIDILNEHCHDLTNTNHQLAQKNEGLKHAVLCLVIVMAGLLISSAAIIMRGGI
ncbi:hypothetical protein [Roseateles sp. PN1]|uniref:hypothetical protein n=1 Tax=Roseateles sp. PN1 TaxID=3137372 RepID=UPI00313876B3